MAGDGGGRSWKSRDEYLLDRRAPALDRRRRRRVPLKQEEAKKNVSVRVLESFVHPVNGCFGSRQAGTARHASVCTNIYTAS